LYRVKERKRDKTEPLTLKKISKESSPDKPGVNTGKVPDKPGINPAQAG